MYMISQNTNGRLEIANAVLKTKDARDVKDLSKKIHTSVRWDQENEQVMSEVLHENVVQVSEVKRVLLETRDKPIVEAIPTSSAGAVASYGKQQGTLTKPKGMERICFVNCGWNCLEVKFTRRKEITMDLRL